MMRLLAPYGRPGAPGGEQSPYYLLAEMVYDSEEQIQKSLASQAGADAVDDLASFAAAEVIVLLADTEEM